MTNSSIAISKMQPKISNTIAISNLPSPKNKKYYDIANIKFNAETLTLYAMNYTLYAIFYVQKT